MDDVGRVKYTPGPWVYEQLEGDWLIAYGDALKHEPRAIAKVFDYAGEFQEADARLIAAAPELYEALNDAVFVIESGQLKGPGAHALASSFRAVLARVKGDQ